MPLLGVNIDHIASIRQLRGGFEPEPVFAALICEAAGADSIVVHLREDRRHINDKDVFLLRRVVKTKLNLEMSTERDIVEVARKLRPDQATLVPERRKELTTEGGLDVSGRISRVKKTVKELQSCGIKVSLFIDPDRKQIMASRDSGVGMIELHTGRFAEAKSKKDKQRRLEELKSAARLGNSIGLIVNAGHGLDYFNVSQVARIKGIEELNIGYSIICRAALVGLACAVREMKKLVNPS